MEYDIQTNGFETKRYYKKGTKIFHREDGPAIEYANGNKEWCINGKLHREDGPAREWGRLKEWFIDGKRHREDGPAIEYHDGTKEWWINGQRLSPEKEAILNQWWEKKNGI